jgi:ribonuclease J
MFFIKKRGVNITRLGAVGVGQNCFLYDDGGDSALLVDCGIKPQTYLERKTSGEEGWGEPPNLDILDAALKKGKRIAAIATHGHLDHIGAMGEIFRRGIPIYLSGWTKRFFQRYSKDMGIPEDARFNVVAENSEITHGNFSVKFIPLEHSIPGTFGLLIQANGKNILHLTDFKFNGMDGRGELGTTLRTIRREAGRVHCLLLDVLNSDLEGFTPPESLVIDEIERIIREAEDRVIISFFSTNLFRMKGIIKAAQRAKKTVGFVGGMWQSYQQIKHELSQQLPPLTPQNCQVLLVGGSQGEENSGLVRIAMGEHPYISIRNRDTVVIAARCIPGNEEPIGNLLTRLKRQNVTIVLHNGERDKLGLNFAVKERPVHWSGHESRGGLGLVAEITDPDVIVPIHALLDRIALFEEMVSGLPIKSRVIRLETKERLTL